MAIGAILSKVVGSSWLELVFLGAAAGLLPDIDVFLTPLSRKAHRSVWTHSLSASVLFSFVWLVIALLVLRGTGLPFADTAIVAASVGTVFLSSFAHAGEDSLTVQGCKLLHPITGRRFSGPFRYDDVVANAILSVVSLAVIFVCLNISV
jgi:membrane-bound metal-dependent hydrolase YbcI (DUF457 family)